MDTNVNCYICWSEEYEAMYKLCNCKELWVHLDCIREWITVSDNLRCGVCKARYRLKRAFACLCTDLAIKNYILLVIAGILSVFLVFVWLYAQVSIPVLFVHTGIQTLLVVCLLMAGVRRCVDTNYKLVPEIESP